jgi:glycosyltransferase 2 family protein
MNPPRSSTRALLYNVLLFAIAGGLLAWVIHQNWDEILKVFQKPVKYRYFGSGMAIYMIALMTTFLRWHQLVRAQGMVFSVRDALRLGFIGNIFNLVIPGAVGGDVIKAGFLCRMQPDKKPQAVASMVLDRILGLLGLFLLASIAGAIYWPSTSTRKLAAVSGESGFDAGFQVRLLIGLIWGALAAGLLGLTVIFSPGLYRPLNKLVSGRGKLEAIVRELEAIGLAYRQNLARVIGMLGVSTCVHGLYVLAFYSASLAIFDKMPTLAEHYLMVPLALFTTAVPLPFGALGLADGISGKLFELVNQHEGAIAMMAFRILMYGSGIVSACVYLANLRQVRDITHEPPLMVGTAVEETVVDPSLAPSPSPASTPTEPAR